MKSSDLNTILLDLAKASIKACLVSTSVPNKTQLIQEYPLFNEKRATFVTLNLNGNLRGCIGSLIPHRTLYEDIVSNAQAAAFDDPRFEPVGLSEIENLEIEISILTIPQYLEYNGKNDLFEKIRPSIDGVIIKSGHHQATFLPQVWEQLPSCELFFEHLCLKAGLEKNCLGKNTEIYVYSVEKISRLK